MELVRADGWWMRLRVVRVGDSEGLRVVGETKIGLK